MRVSTLCHGVPLLAIALAPVVSAAYDVISKPLQGKEGVNNSDTSDLLPTSSDPISYRINGPSQLAVINTKYDCPPRLEAHQFYIPGNDTNEPELLQLEHCTARCMNLPEGKRGHSVELSFSEPIVAGKKPGRPYARLYEKRDCRGVGKEAAVRMDKKYACVNVEDGFWNPSRKGGFESFMVWEGCRYLETEDQKREKLRNEMLRKELEKAKADIEKARWDAVEQERKIEKEEEKLEKKLEKQKEKERLKKWQKEQKERIKQDKQDRKKEDRKSTLYGKERKAAWDARKAQRKKDMKAQFEEWKQDRLMQLKEDGARERAERKAQRQKGREYRKVELLEMERQWEQDRRDKVVKDDKEWEELLAEEAIERAEDEKEEEMLEAAEAVAKKEDKRANENMKRDIKGGPAHRRFSGSGSAAPEGRSKWIDVDGFVRIW